MTEYPKCVVCGKEAQVINGVITSYMNCPMIVCSEDCADEWFKRNQVLKTIPQFEDLLTDPRIYRLDVMQIRNIKIQMGQVYQGIEAALDNIAQAVRNTALLLRSIQLPMNEMDEKEIVELMGERVHDMWMEKRKIDKGWHHPNDCPNCEHKYISVPGIPPTPNCPTCHPCMVPYSELPDSEKVLDRQYPRVLFDILKEKGYVLWKSELKEE